MKRITTFLVGLAFATAGSIGAVSAHAGNPADDFPLPLPADVSIGQVFITQTANFIDPNTSTDQTWGASTVSGSATGSFVAWFENPTIDALGDFGDILSQITWEVFASNGTTLLATGNLGNDHHSVISFLSNTDSMFLKVSGFADQTGQFNIGLAVAYVPEPATWIMMILGFGLIGLQMRRQARIRVEMA